MIIDNNEIEFIENAVKTAKLVNIDSIIIETGMVRALSEDKTAFIFQDQSVPAFSFSSIGLNRLDVFQNRLEIAMACDNFSVDATADDSGSFIKSLIMKGKGVKIDYRCANPKNIIAPKKFNDIIKTQVEISSDAVSMMQKGQVAMRSETITLINNEKGVTFELMDINSDVFSHTFTTITKNLTADTDTRFVFKYPVKLLLTLLKNNPNGYFNVGQKGILNVLVNKLNVFILPQV